MSAKAHVSPRTVRTWLVLHVEVHVPDSIPTPTLDPWYALGIVSAVLEDAGVAVLEGDVTQEPQS